MTKITKEKAISIIALTIIGAMIVISLIFTDKSIDYKCEYTFRTQFVNGSAQGQSIFVSPSHDYDGFCRNIDKICNNMITELGMSCNLQIDYVQGGWENQRIRDKNCVCMTYRLGE